MPCIARRAWLGITFVFLTACPTQSYAQKLISLCLQVSNTVNGVKTTSCVPISSTNPLPVTSSGSGTASAPGASPLAICVQIANGSCVPVSISNPLPVTGGGSGGPPVPPVVTTGNFSISLPLTNGQTVGTMVASGSPTGWVITSCNAGCAGYFAISSSGVITVTPTGASGAVAGTYVIGVQATNAGGNGTGVADVAVNALANLPFALPTGDVLHYADPAGSDSNDGLAPVVGGGHGPWAVATNHLLNCGDVVIAAAGSYPQQGPSGVVSNCPSNSGGIDGTGGIWFATVLCGGTSVGDCYMTTRLPTTGVTDAVFINSSNWAFEGWYCNPALATGAGGVPLGRCYESNANAVILHHIAFVNDISADSLQGADTDDNGQTGAVGIDYFAVVGMAAQNSAQDGICLAAIDVVGPGVFDTLPGTHFYVSGNFSYANANVPCRSVSDTEDYMADTWDRHGVSSQGIYSNNIGFSADRNCIQVFEQSNSTSTPTIKLYNNSCYGDNLNTGTDNSDAEINLNSTVNPMLWTLSIQNNLAYQPLALSSGGHIVFAFEVAQANASLTNGGSGAQNFFQGAATFCPGNAVCDSAVTPVSAAAFTPATAGELGTNFYLNPSYTNVADLVANRQGIPNCSGFENVAQCMGWNAATGVLTTPSVISDLVPTASGTVGKGYQLPAKNCVTTGPIAADYPVWLKGIVYLHWNGTSLSENSGLVTRPCGM
jgi:hypothetical protein